MNNTAQIEKKWQVEGYRLSAFPVPSPSFPPEKHGWFAEMCGHVPDNKQTDVKRGISNESGSYKKGILTLSVQSDRCDIYYAPENVDKPITFLTIGDADSSLTDFVLPANKWLNLKIPLMRLAFGSVLLFPSVDRKSAYEYMATLLPNVKINDINNTHDFFYQVNRPRKSKVDIKNQNGLPLEINRLVKFSVVKLSIQELRIVEGKQALVIKENNQFAVRLEVDINTSQFYAEQLPANNIVDLFSELVSLANEFASQGDVV